MNIKAIISKTITAYLVFVLYLLNIPVGHTQENTIFKKNKAVVSGNVQQLEKSASKVISLTYSQLKGSPTQLAIILDSMGNFQFDFEISQAHDVTLRYEQGQATLYVKPLDSLYVRINASDFQKKEYPLYLVSGTNPETSRDMLKYNLFNTLARFEPAPADKSPKEYLKDLKNRMQKEDSLLSVFNLNNNPTPEFRVWAKKDIIYRNANYLVDFEYFHFSKQTKFQGVLYDTTLFAVNDKSAMASSWYQYYVWQYVQNKYVMGDSTARKFIETKKNGEAYTASLKAIITHEKPGFGRDIMCYQILASLAERENETFQKLMPDAARYVSDKELISVLTDEQLLSKNQSKYAVSLLKSGSKEETGMIGDILSSLISTHRGKIIYIDFWATWCGPCRAEVPFAIDLHDFYKDKPIVFVNFCLFSEREAWKNAIDKQKIAGENYFFDKDQSGLLKSKLKLKGFPTYMIIGKDGQIINRDAARPSSGDALKTYLTRLVN